ncbi:MAG: glycosyltransferase family 39 protein [bacterium]|nr:glycosyltransferase family 39 protein [bacterium]
MKRLIINGVFVLLVFVSLGVFIYYHRIPLNPGIFYLQGFFRYWSCNFILHNLQEFFLLTLLILTAMGIGYKLLKLFRMKFYSLGVEFIFSTGLGLGFFSLLTLGAGFLGLLSPVIFYPLILITFLVSMREIGRIGRIGQIQFDCFSIISGTCLGIILLLGIILAIGGPPILFDSLVYHLAIPDIYLENHKIVNIPYLVFSNYPLNVEMLFAMAMGLKGDTLAQLIHFSFGILTGLSIYVLTKTYFGRRQGLIAMLIFFSMPSILLTMTFTFNDLGLTYYVVLAVYAMISWRKINDNRWLILSGLMTGLAIGVKYSGIICLILLLGTIVITRYRTPKVALKESFIFLLTALLPVIPYLIKNLIFVGNPVYPFLYEVFGGENWSDFNSLRFTQEMSHYGPGHSGILRYLSLPFFITCDWKTGDIPIGPLLFACLPFLFFIKNVDKTIKYLLVFCGVYFLVWINTSMVIRFLFPALVLLCPVAGYVIKELKGKLPLLPPLFESAIVMALILNIYTLYTAIGEHPDFYLGNKTRVTSYPRQEKLLSAEPVKDYYQVIKFINEQLPQGSKILFIGEPRRYYCQRMVLTSSELDTAIISELVKESRNTKEIFVRLRILGVTHILYNKHNTGWLIRQFNHFNWKDKTEEARYESFITSLDPIYIVNDVYLFKIPHL